VHRFYVPGFTLDREAQLPDDEAQHLARVLRLKVGDAIAIFDGKGVEASARVEAISARKVVVRPVEPRRPAAELKVPLTLAQALLKSDKMDRVIRDAIMLGATTLQPFVSTRTDVPRAAVRTGGRKDRWGRTAISSVKQSGRAVVPMIHDVVEFEDVLKASQSSYRVMFVEPAAYREGSVQPVRALERDVPASAVILIGPEGGWEPGEIKGADAAGVKLVTFGSRTLRADAAGAAALTLLQYVWDL
jgi:16S rRNA (uracil1498-N3)-methyltransferase